MSALSHKHIISSLGVAAALGLSACTAGQTGPPPVTSVNTSTVGVLQFAVGTANVAGTAGLNVAATYRQSNGRSALLASTPRLTGPFTLTGTGAAPTGFYGTGPSFFSQPDSVATADLGPSTDEIAKDYIGGTPQTSASNADQGVPTTFGASGSVFSNGFFPGNYTTQGNPYSYNPYYQPFYAGTGPAAFLAIGGPPAFDPNGDGAGTQDGSFNTPILGVSLGLSVFEGVTPVAGTYNLSVTPATGGAAAVQAAPAHLTGGALLPAAAAPVVTFAGDGSASVSYTLPAGVVGAYVQVLDTSYCTGKPFAYTFWVTASGTSSIPNTLGRHGKSGGPAICTAAMNTSAAGQPAAGDPVQAVLIGFDYNQYALQLNGSANFTYPQAPALPAQADVTMSPIANYAQNADGTVTVSSARQAARAKHTRE